MELADLMKLIANNNIPHFMIWFGEEQKILDLYINQLSFKGYKMEFVDSVSYVLNRINRKSLDKSDKLYIISEDTDYQKAETKWKEVKSTFNKSNHIVILRYTTLNKKLKFYTQNKEDCIEFVHLNTDILVKYIQKDINLSEDNCEKLISMCGNDYGRILLEIDKINQYLNGRKKDIFPNDAFNILCEQGAIYSEIGDITFELTNAVLGGYPDKAVQRLDEAKRKGEPTLRIVSILYEGFRNLVAYNALGKDKHEAGKRTGMTGWQIKQCIDLNGGYSMKELIRNMMLCQKVESGIKSGTIEEEIALDYCVLSCLK